MSSTYWCKEGIYEIYSPDRSLSVSVEFENNKLHIVRVNNLISGKSCDLENLKFEEDISPKDDKKLEDVS